MSVSLFDAFLAFYAIKTHCLYPDIFDIKVIVPTYVLILFSCQCLPCIFNLSKENITVRYAMSNVEEQKFSELSCCLSRLGIKFSV